MTTPLAATPAPVQRWLRFNAVGAVGIAVQLALLTLFHHVLHLHYLTATVLAVEVTVLHNFALHERWTWWDRRAAGRRQMYARMMQFNLTTGVVSMVGNLLSMRLLVGELYLTPVIANMLTIALCSIANFAISEVWVFRQARTDGGASV